MEQALIAGIATIIAAAAALLVEWARSDAKLISLPRAIEDYLKASQFLDAWSKTYQQIETLPDSKGKDLAKSYAELILANANAKLAEATSKATVTEVGQGTSAKLFAVANLVRLRAPKYAILWIPQLLYYAAVALTIRVVWMEKSLLSLAVALCAGSAFLLWLICWFSERTQARPMPRLP